MQNNKQNTFKKLPNIPHGKMADGDWFKCEKCGATIRMKVLGNHATCPECGGMMVRT